MSTPNENPEKESAADQPDVPYVGRASVRPVSPAPAMGSAPIGASAPVTGSAAVPGSVSGSASVPGSASGSAAVSGSASVPRAAGPSQPSFAQTPMEPTLLEAAPKPAKSKKAKQRKRRNLIIAGVAVLVLLSGVGVIGGTYFYDQVPQPSELTLKNTTEVFAADTTTQLAKLGTENRSEVSMDSLPKPIKDALIAGEDKNFYDHQGIDLWGIGRAAWNNLTGGATQGASTITQQYARQAANDMDISYARKAREAVMARKLEDEYNKDQILGFYLNTVYFGRGAYGIGAAAQAYFNIPPDQIGTLKVEQAAVLGAVLKQPEPQGNVPGFDPDNDPQAAQDRWSYVLGNMVEMNWLTAEARAAMTYPEVVKFDKNSGAGAWGYTDRGTGYVINYVARELDERGIVGYLNENLLGNWKNAGLRITTTINPGVQAAMEAQLNRAVAGSWVAGQPANIVGAAVAIEPGTGKVLAYYGGTNNGTETDWAGNEQPHQPASSFKIYTLLAAVEANISVQSHWDSTEMSKAKGDPVDLGNSRREADPQCGEFCTLDVMTEQSYNVPFYRIAEQLGYKKVLDTARRAGIQNVWTTDPLKPYNTGDTPDNTFDPYLGIGQYPITVLDHATGTSTVANHGVYNKPNFVQKVERKNRKTGAWEELEMKPLAQGEQRIKKEHADEVTQVLKKIGPNLAGGFERAGKTGTWENGLKKPDGKTYVYPNSNAHAWYTGYTNQLATSIWIGSLDVNTTPIKKANGGTIGSGDVKEIWGKYMNQVNKDLGLKSEKLAADPGDLGSKDLGNGKSPSPSPSPEPEPSTPPSPSNSPSPTPSPTGAPTAKPSATKSP
jgi:membrane peptidoglycan carboxypeptidase